MNETTPAQRLRALIDSQNGRDLAAYFASFSPEEAAHIVSRLDEEEQAQLWATLPPEDAAVLVQSLPLALVAEQINPLDPATAAAILNRLPSDEQTDVLAHLNPEQAKAVLARMAPAEVADVKRLSPFPSDTAGGLMETEYLAYPANEKVANVIRDLRSRASEYAAYQVQYAYVVDEEGALIGVVRLRDLLFHTDDEPLARVALPKPIAVQADASLDELHGFFERCHFLAAPVVDAENRLLGVVTRADLEAAVADRAEQTFLRFSGLLGEEFRTMPLAARVGGRLAWLSITLILSFVAASVVGLFQETLSEAIALAVFLPVIACMSGNAGNQSIAVTMRELSTGLVKPHEVSWVLLKEASVGVVNGVLIGLALAIVALLWKGEPLLGLVVASAQTLSVLFAGCLGGIIPLVLKRLGFDPALASAPILTTLTDASGFFLALGLASLWLDK